MEGNCFIFDRNGQAPYRCKIQGTIFPFELNIPGQPDHWQEV